jgi:transcriptional regulator with XRE-family HTH domain
VDFYDRFIKLCAEKGVKPSPMLESIGIQKTASTNWKLRRSRPTDANMQKIADYFDVSVEYLRGETNQKRKNLINNDEELTDLLEAIKDMEEMRALFKISSKATKADVEQTIRILQALKGENNGVD